MSRTFRRVAAMLSVCLLTGAPTHAAPVAISEVIQVVGHYQNPPELRLRSLTQTAGTPISSEAKGSIINSGVQQTSDGLGTIADGTVVPATGSLLSGLANDPQRGVEIIDQGEVEGTICDCGDILIPGAFPKWPLLFLAAIPLFFIDTGDDIIPTPTPGPTPGPSPQPTQFSLPTPTPTPQTPVPEPASLLLFGTGLAAFAAGLRRRSAKSRMKAKGDPTKEA
ncbi:MAG: PEP-CTERM sorting domain-containing protein [Pyrinomonadaceae bacterium]|nr:PEP-CTERM sorting domain-containing protein [Pyrinomonadaceae bacterium]